jgi:restriction system protein
MAWILIIFIGYLLIIALSALAAALPPLLSAIYMAIIGLAILVYKVTIGLILQVDRLSDWISKRILASVAKKRWAIAYEEWLDKKLKFEEELEVSQNINKSKNLQAYSEAVEKWEKQVEIIKEKHRLTNEAARTKWEERVASIKSAWEKQKNNKINVWNKELKEAENVYSENYRIYKGLKTNFINADSKAVQSVCEKVLKVHHKQYSFIQECKSQYISDNRLLIIDCRLPSPDDLPRLKERKFIKSREDFKDFYYSDSELNNLYDETLYQLVLGDIAQVFGIQGSLEIIDSVIFNGYVLTTSKSTGTNNKACILSIHVNRVNFAKLNLLKVEAKECFKFLKGVGSSKLYAITPISPIMKINMEDKRFIQAYDVAYSLSEATNLAAMDWQDFEHLVREIFQKMFSSDGVEVKVTQSSRDKGVDAIAIDPNPVRGGKIVIQAKRYTNVVGVSAVRDLWGTVMNEGAMKGILVTTSNFGSDAYDFVKGKPLTLISGGELLSFLSQNGYKAKIDLREAKKILYD